MVEGLADGSEAGLAHLSHAAATGFAAPRPQRSAQFNFAYPARRARGVW